MPDDQERGLNNWRGGSIYRAFLLRCWREAEAGPEGQPEWFFALVHSNDRQITKRFAGLEALVAYLRAELEREDRR